MKIQLLKLIIILISRLPARNCCYDNLFESVTIHVASLGFVPLNIDFNIYLIYIFSYLQNFDLRLQAYFLYLSIIFRNKRYESR